MKPYRRSLFTFALITLAIGVVLLGITYYFFHFVTDDGPTLVFHEEAGKPFVTMLIGVFAVHFVAASALSALIALIFFNTAKATAGEANE